MAYRRNAASSSGLEVEYTKPHMLNWSSRFLTELGYPLSVGNHYYLLRKVELPFPIAGDCFCT